jgi:hypothetical protein
MPKDTKGKDKTAQAMVRKRWDKATAEDRRRVGAMLALARKRKRRKS